MKGDGYFEFEVKPFVFKLNTFGTSFSPSKGDWIIIKNKTTGQNLLKGKIDEILDDESPQPEIIVFPQALLLKDFIVGDELELSDTESVVDYEFGVRHIRDTVNDILTRINASEGTTMSCNDVTIPDVVNTGKFFGNKLKKFGNSSLVDSILDILLGGGDSFYVTKTDGDDYYLIHKDAYFRNRIVVEEGDWLNVSLGTIFGHHFPRWHVPSSDFTLPTADRTFHVWRLAGGGLDYINDFDTADGFGSNTTALEATNVPEAELLAFAKQKGMTRDARIIFSFDYDSNNTYALVKGKYRNDYAEYILAISFETAFDDKYGGHYRDNTAMDIIRDLAVMSNRWLYVDREGMVYMLPRTSSRGSISLTADKTLGYTKKVMQEQDRDIAVNQYEENDDGEITSFGLVIRKNELEAVSSYYKGLFAGEVTQYTLEMYDSIDDDILKSVAWDYKPTFDSIGKVISIEHSLLEKRARVVIEDGL